MSWLDRVELERNAVSPELLRVAMPRCAEPVEWADQLSDALAWGGVTDPDEIALFLAHAGHESSDLNRLEENLNYSVQALLKVFGRHRITGAQARRYGRSRQHPADQKAIANTIYGGEWGRINLGNTEPGDGWRHRGMGPIQLTGKANQMACQEATGLDIMAGPERLATNARYGARSAAWYWITRVTPGGDIRSTTIEVNGGAHGLADRKRRHDRIIHFMNSAEA